MSWKKHSAPERRESDEAPLRTARVRPRYIHYAWIGMSAAVIAVSAVYQLQGLSVLGLALGVLTLGLIDLSALLTLSYPVYALGGAVASVAVIESGAYVTEQYRYGFNIGASGVFALYALGFIALAHFVISIFSERLSRPRPMFASKTLVFYILATSVGSAVFYGAVFVVYGPALSYATRFAWLNELPDVVVAGHTILRSYLIPVAFALAGILLAVHGWRRCWAALTLVAPVVCVFAAGDKFSGFVLQLMMFLLGVGIGCLASGERLRIRLRYLGWAIVALAIAAVLVALGYMRSGAENALSAIGDRLALQGHVWFGTFDLFGGLPGMDLLSMVRENTYESPSGLDALSYVVSDPDFVYERLGRGVTFTMGGPATALAAFGAWGGLLVYALTALLYAGVVCWIVRLGSRQLCIPAIALLVLYIVVGAGTQMGYWDALYGPVALAGYAVLLACGVGSLVYPRWRKRRLSVRT